MERGSLKMVVVRARPGHRNPCLRSIKLARAGAEITGKTGKVRSCLLGPTVVGGGGFFFLKPKVTQKQLRQGVGYSSWCALDMSEYYGAPYCVAPDFWCTAGYVGF